MPRRRRCHGTALAGKARLNNNHLPADDSCLDDDLDECGSPLSPQGEGGAGQPPQRNAANARERARMRVLSRAFCRLKTTLPWVPADTKLSKLDTLRLATSYIAHLRDVLLLPQGEDPSAAPHAAHHAAGTAPNPLNLVGSMSAVTWPFAFPQTGAPGVPGTEPWISRGSSASSRAALPLSSRLAGPAGHATHAAHAASVPCSGASSNASSSGADDDLSVKDDEHADLDDAACRRGRGLSGGHLVALQQSCQQYSPQYAPPFLHRYVDAVGCSGAL